MSQKSPTGRIAASIISRGYNYKHIYIGTEYYGCKLILKEQHTYMYIETKPETR